MGRPLYGLMKFGDSILASLPERGSVPEYARILGISLTTLRHWTAEFRTILGEQSCTIILREPFIAWLKKSGRYREDPVLDFTDQVVKLGPEAQAFVRSWSAAVPLSASFVAEFLKVLEAERKRF